MKKIMKSIVLFIIISVIATPIWAIPPSPGGSSISAASTAEVAAGTNETKFVNPKELKTVTDGLSSTPSGKVCKTIRNVSGTDNLKFDIAATRTITKVSGFCDPAGTTASFILKDYGTDGATGPTNIHDSLTIDNDGANTGTISYEITDGSLIRAVFSAISGVVTEVIICYE